MNLMEIESSDEGVVLRTDVVDVRLSVEDLAACFANLGSTEQARFLVEVARRFDCFKGVLGPDGQALTVGEDLAKLEGGERATELLKLIVDGFEDGTVGQVMGS